MYRIKATDRFSCAAIEKIESTDTMEEMGARELYTVALDLVVEETLE